MRHTFYVILSITSIAVISYGASQRLGIWGALPSPSLVPGTYRSLGGTQFFDDARDIRPALAYDLERLCYGANRSITGGTVEPSGTFNLESPVPYGAHVKILSGRYAGDRGYIRADALSGNRVRRIGDLSNISRKVGTR